MPLIRTTYKAPRVPSAAIVSTVEASIERLSAALPLSADPEAVSTLPFLHSAADQAQRDESGNEAVSDDELDEFDVDAFLDTEDEEESEFHEVEVAIEEFISSMPEKYRQRGVQRSSFRSVFESIFGVGTEIADAAKRFEQHIASYFGFLSEKRQRLAAAELDRLKRLVSEQSKAKQNDSRA